MLTWKNGKVEEFSKWPGFHKDAKNSTGFQAKANENHGEDGDVSEIVRYTIVENMAVYDMG